MKAFQVEFVSDSSIIAGVSGTPSLANSRKILDLFAHLQSARETPITGLHPAYCSLLIDFDSRLCDPNKLLKFIESAANGKIKSSAALPGSLVTIPVHYGDSAGPDLKEVASLTGLSVDEVIRLHTGGEYTVAFLGFAPGFPYLLGLDKKLHCARKSSPQVRVRAGSVAIAGEQAGIYPIDSPGGWQCIGRTDRILFDPSQTPATLLKPGDRVRFEARPEQISIPTKVQGPEAAESHSPIFKLESGGIFSSVQDLGRAGWTHLGISPGGAADPLALQIGNRLVGNEDDAAAVELTAQGLVVGFLKDTWLAITGAECSPHLDQQKVALWTSIPVSSGQRLVIGNMEKNQRSYLCVYGGIGVEPVLGSRSTSLSGKWGGFGGRELRAGDHLPAGEQGKLSPGFRKCDTALRKLYGESRGVLRVTRGPQWSWFSNEERKNFFLSEFAVTDEANRLGLRLLGPLLKYAGTFLHQELISEGIADGSIQIPASGQPLILFCEQRTTGGYPKIASVIRADRFRLGQLKPGDKIRFVEVDFEEAWRLDLELEKSLQTALHTF